eukprot:jgi/Orpsp1_1/1189347/evm.model.d7180000071314.1
MLIKESLDILIDTMNCILQKYSYVRELLISDNPSLSQDDTLINELYIASKMTDTLENQILYYYDNANKNSKLLNKKWKEHLTDIEKERQKLKSNKIYYYQTLSELIKHASFCFEIQKVELECSIQNYIKHDLIPQLDNDSISNEEFLKYYKLISGLINDINNTNFPIIIEK